MSNQYGDKNLKIFSLNSNPEPCKRNRRYSWSSIREMFCHKI